MQPLFFLITTAGNDTHSICYEQHEKALDIMSGRKIDPTFYPVIYGADESEDWTDPGVEESQSLPRHHGRHRQGASRLRLRKAESRRGERFPAAKLNQWVKQSVRWMPMDKWDACAFPVNEDDLEGRICYGGLDLSSTTDITAFVLGVPSA
jgi:phage terminase large subunit-like protein